MSERPTINLKVGARTVANKAAGSIARNIRENKKVIVSAVGAGASHQMLKAMIIAQGMVAQNGGSLSWRVAFGKGLTNDGVQRTIIEAHALVD